MVAARKESGAEGQPRSGMEVGEAYATGGQLVEDGRLDGTPVTTEVPVAQVVNEQSDDIRTFVLGKSRTKQKEGGKDGKVEFHLISFAIFKETVRPFEFHS